MCAGGCTPPKFSSTPSEKFENGVHTLGYYFYYRFYLKKLIDLAVRIYGLMVICLKKNTTAQSAPLVAHQCTPLGKSARLLSDEHWSAPGNKQLKFYKNSLIFCSWNENVVLATKHQWTFIKLYPRVSVSWHLICECDDYTSLNFEVDSPVHFVSK